MKNDDKKKRLITYIKNSGIEIHTKTKARGHQGFFMKNRIDISTNIKEERIIPTILHEYAHYVHNNLEDDIASNGGTFEKIFNTNENMDKIKEELVKVTAIVDPNSKFEVYKLHKTKLNDELKKHDKIIKAKYPRFLRTKCFKEFNNYIRTSKAKYLLKYDRIKIYTGVIFKKVEFLSIDSIEEQFPDMPKEFASYIRLKSLQKKISKLSAKMNKMNKYYNKPTELFARFVEGLYINPIEVRRIAPYSYSQFIYLLHTGYYGNLDDIFKIVL